MPLPSIDAGQLIPVSIHSKWEKNGRMEYMEKGMNLPILCERHLNIGAQNQAFFYVGESVVQKQRGMGQRIPDINPDARRITVGVETYLVKGFHDHVSLMKGIVNVRELTLLSAANALGASADEMVIDAIEKEVSKSKFPSANKIAIDFGEDAAAGMTLKKALQIKKVLTDNHAYEGDKVCVVVGPAQEMDLMQVEEFSSQDYTNYTSAIYGNRKAFSRPWLGLEWKISTQLPKDGSTRTCFAFKQESVGYVSVQDYKLTIAWDNDRNGYTLLHQSTRGAGVLKPRGLISIECKET